MRISAVSHEEATIRSFVRDPEFAEFFLKDVLSDGDMEEIREAKAWVEEARARRERARRPAGAAHGNFVDALRSPNLNAH